MPYVSDATVKSYFAAYLGESAAANLMTRFDTLIPFANADAYNHIVSALADRGFSAAEIAAWDRGPEFNRDLACCLLLRNPIAGEASDLWQQKFCRQEELETVPVTVGGEVVTPSSSTGGVGYGDMERSDDVFTRGMSW